MISGTAGVIKVAGLLKREPFPSILLMRLCGEVMKTEIIVNANKLTVLKIAYLFLTPFPKVRISSQRSNLFLLPFSSIKNFPSKKRSGFNKQSGS